MYNIQYAKCCSSCVHYGSNGNNTGKCNLIGIYVHRVQVCPNFIGSKKKIQGVENQLKKNYNDDRTDLRR
jgi:hypothetical protein